MEIVCDYFSVVLKLTLAGREQDYCPNKAKVQVEYNYAPLFAYFSF